MKTTVRIYSTADGRLVEAGHPDAAFLAYPVGVDIAEPVARKVEKAEAPKQATRPSNKARKPAGDKSSGNSEE